MEMLIEYITKRFYLFVYVDLTYIKEYSNTFLLCFKAENDIFFLFFFQLLTHEFVIFRLETQIVSQQFVIL